MYESEGSSRPTATWIDESLGRYTQPGWLQGAHRAATVLPCGAFAIEVVGCQCPVRDAFTAVEVYGAPALRLILQVGPDHACATALTLPFDAICHIGDRAIGLDGVALPQLEEPEVVLNSRDERGIPECRMG